ncbi:HalOD1 output domain-containing protein [Halorarum halophilum]|nr:HalOD1 output domain-containing protein [Halobaculum halophilum]
MAADSADNRGITGTVVEAVADETDVSPTDISPQLYDTVDPDALDSLVRSRTGNGLRVRFRYHGCTVVVDGTGRVTASRRESTGALAEHVPDDG